MPLRCARPEPYHCENEANTSKLKEPATPVMSVCISYIVKFGFQLQRQTSHKIYPDRRGPYTGENFVEEKIQCHVKVFSRMIPGDEKLKHKRQGPGSGVVSSEYSLRHEK